jgi:cytidine deaminase
MKLDQALVQAAIDLLNARFASAGGLAAAIRTEDGDILTSIFFQPDWGGGGLCAETGAILEAHKRNKQIAAVVCVSRLSGTHPIVIAAPCGICQERLFHWGANVAVAVPDPADGTHWLAKTLRDVQPYYWVNVFGAEPGPTTLKND